MCRLELRYQQMFVDRQTRVVCIQGTMPHYKKKPLVYSQYMIQRNIALYNNAVKTLKPNS